MISALRVRSLPVLSTEALSAVVLLLIALVYSSGMLAVENYNGDQARYLGLAESILNYGTYEFNFRPHTRFPPGTSIYYSIGYMIFGHGYQSAAFMNFLAVLGFFAVSCLLLNRLGARKLVPLFLVLTAVNIHIFTRATRFISSDFLYSFISILALVVADRKDSRWWMNILLGILVVSSIMVRSTGLALIPALIIGKRFFAAFCGGIFYALWNTWKQLNQINVLDNEFMNSYASQLAMADAARPLAGEVTIFGLVQRVTENLLSKLSDFSEIFLQLGWTDPVWFSPLVLIPFVVTLRGLVKSRNLLFASYCIFYLGVVLLWPFDEGHRYLFPVLPLLFFYFAKGLKDISVNWVLPLLVAATALLFSEIDGKQKVLFIAFWLGLAVWLRSKKQLDARVLAGVFLAVLGIGFYNTSRLYTQNLNLAPEVFRKRFAVAAIERLSGHLEPGQSVMTSQDGLVFQLTKHRGVEFPVTDDANQIMSVARSTNTRFLIVLSDEEHPYFYPPESTRLELLENEFPESIKLFDHGTHWKIFEII